MRQVSLGWHWYPYGYAEKAVDGDGAAVKPFPTWLGRWAREAVHDAYQGGDEGGRHRVRWRPPDGPPGARLGVGALTGQTPSYDIALINFYDAHARMGMHQDRDEISHAPVVSFSLGDTCVFRFGHSLDRGKPYVDLDLGSGDAFVFGGPARLAFHGVPRTRPGTAPRWLALRGRLNVTVRQR